MGLLDFLNSEESKFHKIIIQIALIIIIIVSILCIILFSVTSNNIKYPPIIANCPDYWEANGDKCVNIHGLGDNCDADINFNQDKYRGIAGLKQKCNLRIE